jgi:hypothetical protein
MPKTTQGQGEKMAQYPMRVWSKQAAPIPPYTKAKGKAHV